MQVFEKLLETMRNTNVRSVTAKAAPEPARSGRQRGTASENNPLALALNFLVISKACIR
jgi:hypothetical protein